MTIQEAYQQMVAQLEDTYGLGEAQSISRIVFEDALKVYNFERTDALVPQNLKQLTNITNRLLRFEPVQYVLGQADFFGLKFKVNPHVLIPRQETEELVYAILETVKRRYGNTVDGSRTNDSPFSPTSPSTIQRFNDSTTPDHAPPSTPQHLNTSTLLDIGTGSACIPISIKKKRPDWEVHALDVSPGALIVAEENAQLNQVQVIFHQLDILDESNWEKLPLFEIIVSNPPYIPESERDLVAENVKQFEPEVALFVENEDPLLFYRKISAFAKKHLKEGGYLYFEVNEFLGEEVLRLMHKNGWSNALLQNDISGKPRIVRAQRLSC